MILATSGHRDIGLSACGIIGAGRAGGVCGAGRAGRAGRVVGHAELSGLEARAGGESSSA